MGAFVLDANIRIVDVIGLQQVQQKVAAVTGGMAVGGAAGVVSAQSTAAAAASAAAINKVAAANAHLVTTSKQASIATVRTTKSLQTGAKAATGFGNQVFLAGKRYGAFIAATAIPFAGLAAIREATQSVIEFDKAVTGVRQITGESIGDIQGLKQEILDLSVATGTSATELANLAQTLAQAGIRGDKLKETLNELAKVPLTPIFGSTASAVEGLLAVTNQFEDQTLSTIEVFDVLANVSKEFAATAEDLFQGFARGGAAFEAVGGTFEEFAAALAVVRQETRESASTVGTFFKTISSRIADPKIRAFLEGKGIKLFDETGQFIGPINAFRKIADALQNIVNVQDKVEIATRVAGRRQVSRFLALADSIDKVDRGIQLANNSAGVFNKISEVGLTTLEAQLNIVAAEFNRLFQTLAEPVFIPLIKGFTQAASAMASLLEFMSPIIPIFTQLVAFAGGVKLLTLSFVGLSKAAGALAGIKFAGLAGLAGGLAGARGGTFVGGGLVPSGLGAGAAGAGAVSANAALAATTTGIVATSKSLIKSQLGQIATVGLAVAGLNSLAENAEKAGNSAAEFAATLARNIGAITLAVSLLSGATPAGLFKGVFTSLLGGLAGAGAVLAAGVVAASSQASEAIERSGAKAAQRISEIDLDFGGGASLQNAVSELGKSLVQRVTDAASEFGNIKTGEQDFGQFIFAAGKGLVDLITGQRGLTDPLIGDEEANELIDNLLGDKGEAAGAIIQQAIVEFGNNFREGLLDQLTKAFGGTEEAVKLAQRVLSRILEQQGTVGITSAKAKGLKLREEAALKEIADKAKKLAAELSAIKIPTAISSELNSLQESVRRTVTSIDNSIQAFDSLAGNIGQIAAPDLGFEVTDKAVEELLKDPQALAEITKGAFGDLTQQAAQVALLKSSLEDLAEAAALAGKDVDQMELQDALEDPVAANKLIGEIINNFIKAQEDLPPDIARKLQVGGKELIRKVLTTTIPDVPSIIEEIIGNVAGDAAEASKLTSDALKQYIQSIFKSGELELKRQQLILQQGSELTRFPDIAQRFRDIAKELIPIVELPVPTQFGDLSRNLAEVGFSVVQTGKFFDAFRNQADIAAQSYTTLTSATSENAAEALEAAKSFIEARKNLNLLRAGASDLVKGLQEELSDIDPELPGGEQRVKALNFAIASLTEGLNQAETAAVARATTEIDAEGNFVGAVDIFGQNVTEFGIIIGALAKSLNLPSLVETGAEEAKTNLADFLTRQEQFAKEQESITKFGVPDIQKLLDAFQEKIATIDVGIPEGGLFGLGDLIGDITKGLAIEQAAKDIAETVAKQAEDKGLPNAENIARNVVNFLLGLSGGDQPSVTIEAQKDLKASIDLNSQEIRTSTEQGRATTSVIEKIVQTQETVTRDTGDERKSIFDTGPLAEELARLREFIGTNPNVDVTPEIIEALKRGEEPVLPEAINIDPANLEAALTPAFTTSLTSALPPAFEPIATAIMASALGAIPGEVGAGDPITQTTNIADQLAVATQATQETATAIAAGGEILQAGSQALLSATEGLSAVIDVQREAVQQNQGVEIASATAELAEINRANTEALNRQNEVISSLNDRLSERIAQVEDPPPISVDDIEIDGLEENSEVVSSNSEALASNRDSVNSLKDELTKTQTVLSDGLNVDLNAVQNLQIDIRGLEDVVTEFSSEFQAVAEEVAKQQIRIALANLADELGNAELSQNVKTTVNNI